VLILFVLHRLRLSHPDADALTRAILGRIDKLVDMKGIFSAGGAGSRFIR